MEEGVKKYYYENGQISVEYNDKTHKLTSWNEKGALRSYSFIIQTGNPRTKEQLLEESWDKNGLKCLERNFDENGYVHGYEKFWDNGRLSQFTLYEHGKHVKYTSWTYGHKNEYREEYVYDTKENSYKRGYYSKEYKNDVLINEGNYLYGRDEHGEHVQYYDNGKLKCKKQYNNGKLDGKYIRWYDNGNIESIKYFSSNSLHGTTTYWDKNGVKTYETIYNHNKNVKSTVCRDDGSIEYITYDKEGKILTDKCYDKNGKLIQDY